jgi:hypothetical protein
VIIFCVGILPLTASVMRLCEVITSGSPKGTSWLVADSGWRWSMVPMWSQIEVDAGIVAASLPSLSPLLKRLWSDLVTHRPSGIATFARPNKRRPLRPHTIGSGPWNSKGRCTYKDDGKYEGCNQGFEMAVLHSPKEATAPEMGMVPTANLKATSWLSDAG